MSWLAATDDTARNLARLLVHGGGVKRVDLDVSIAARARVLDLAAALHLDASRATGQGRLPAVADVDADPVRLMGRLLAMQPRPVQPVAVSDILAAPAASQVGRLWQQVARSAAIAGHDWHAADRATRPRGDGRWTVLSRAAALAEAATLLDRDLAASATAGGRSETAQALTRAGWSRLAGTPAPRPHPAAFGDLPEVADVVPPTSRRVLAVRSLADVPAATDRLAHLVATATSLSPRQVQQITRAQAHHTLRAARHLDSVLPHPASAEYVGVVQNLAEHARILADAAGRPRRTESVYPSDPRPLAQAAEITRYLAAGTGACATPGRMVGVLVDVARAAAGVTTALEATARRQVDAGRWLVPAPEGANTAVHWAQATTVTPTPPLVTALGTAAGHAGDLAAASARALPGADAVVPAPPAMPGARDLAAALAAARAAQVRPVTPGTPVGYRSPNAPSVRHRRERGH